MKERTEKRQHPRLATTYLCRYRKHNRDVGYDISQTQDISRGGVLLLTHKMFQQGDQLEMQIQFPFARKKEMVVGEVVDCNEVSKDVLYETRVKFVEMDDEVKQKLADILERRRSMGQR